MHNCHTKGGKECTTVTQRAERMHECGKNAYLSQRERQECTTVTQRAARMHIRHTESGKECTTVTQKAERMHNCHLDESIPLYQTGKNAHNCHTEGGKNAYLSHRGRQECISVAQECITIAGFSNVYNFLVNLVYLNRNLL